MAHFFDRFRQEIARYAAGVHHTNAPADPAALKGLPAELASFLRSWNGAELFIDAVTIFDAASVRPEGELTVFGVTSTGDLLALSPAGAVVRVEEDTGEALVEGTSFARWLEAFVVAEGVLVDREGEFKDDAFDEDGEPSLAAQERRERKFLKIDADAPAPAWRLARAVERAGRPDEARKLLDKLVARVPAFGWAWFDLGRLRRAADDAASAELAFARAAEADPAYEHAGYFAAHAARAAAARGDDAARARHAARALELDPDVGRLQKEAARQVDDPAAAREAAELAVAVLPRDLEALDLLRRSSG